MNRFFLWFSNKRALIREIKRLSQALRDESARRLSVENDNKMLAALMMRRSELFVDRILTSQLKTYAVSDEARRKVAESPESAKQEALTALDAYLIGEKLKLEQEAKEAGKTPEEAHMKYQELIPELTAEFQSLNGNSNIFGFNN